MSHGFSKNQLFSSVEAKAESGRIHIISGANGSGKSTFLRILSGALEPWTGTVQYQIGNYSPDAEAIHRQVAMVAPYQELPEEFSLIELINIQKQLDGSLEKDSSYRELAEYFGVWSSREKHLRDFSTGMKQKARFVLAFGSRRPVWLLDEPGSNLDAESCSLLQAFLLKSCSEKLIILASNDASELAIGKELVAL